MSAEQLEAGYWRAYRDFYRWAIDRRAAPRRTPTAIAGLRHFAYAAGWKKFEPLWDLVIRAKRAGTMLPVLETILSEFGRRATGSLTNRLGRSRTGEESRQLHPGVQGDARVPIGNLVE